MPDTSSDTSSDIPSDLTTPAVQPRDGLAMPRDFGAGYGEGLASGVSLGGGGVFFVAWQVAYVAALAERGVDLAGGARVVGTSAGSLVSSVLEAGNMAGACRAVVLNLTDADELRTFLA